MRSVGVAVPVYVLSWWKVFQSQQSIVDASEQSDQHSDRRAFTPAATMSEMAE